MPTSKTGLRVIVSTYTHMHSIMVVRIARRVARRAARICSNSSKESDAEHNVERLARTARPYSSKELDVDHVIESRLDKTTFRKRGTGTPLTTTRREALSLYREIMRITALFDWPNERGDVWRDVLRASARQEFEEARHERDPEIINRLLVVGRDAVSRVSERFVEELQKRGGDVPR